MRFRWRLWPLRQPIKAWPSVPPLIKQSIEKCKELGIEAIVVVGHADYYPPFRFGAEIAECLKIPFSGNFFMVKPLKERGFAEFSGIVIYPDAFGPFLHE